MLLHGLFGTGSNLGAVARALKDDFRIYSVDLPDHGKSDWLQHADIPSMAETVISWMDTQDLQEALFVGHSLGGKVAMQLALGSPARVRALCVADIAPVQYQPHHDAILAGLAAVTDALCHSRTDADDVLADYVREQAVRQFLLKSLKPDAAGQYRWLFNVQGIVANYASILAAPTGGSVFSGPTLFVKGEDSDYILPAYQDATLTLFPAATMKTMAHCGHWLHAQNPVLFNSIIRRFLLDVGGLTKALGNS
ncbi:MAG: esterase [Halioglobus sp.]